MNLSTLKRIKTIGFWALYAFIIIYSIFPLYYAILTSFKTGQALFEVDYLIKTIDFINYNLLFSQQSFGRIILNSILVSTIVVVISLIIGISAAYALGRVNFKGKTLIMYVILGVSMFPQIAVLSGLFTLLRTLNLFNNPFGLAMTYMIFTLPFTVWVLTSFMKQLPKELEEAAVVDGCNPLQTVVLIFLPVMGPAAITTGLLAFIAAWNEFLFALTYTINESARTIPVAISMITGATRFEVPWGAIMAASVLVTFPLIILVLFFQKRIVSGLTAGAVKG